ncbi:maltotransferase domain-containing protein, partial [Streptomyces sp. NPDC018057]|uniref:maltotransferase domain-containing protein n=1 Tax=unclassified Streptomyces TaxID=2593676 RepID=UPI0037BDA84D
MPSRQHPAPSPAGGRKGTRRPRAAGPPAPAEQSAQTAQSAQSAPEDPAVAAVPEEAAPPPPAAPEDAPEAAPTAVGRIPVLDVRPVVQHGRRPAKAVTGESFQVTATVFGEGHDAVAANVVLCDPAGRPGPWTPMRELAPGTDRWGAEVTPTATG